MHLDAKMLLCNDQKNVKAKLMTDDDDDDDDDEIHNNEVCL